MSEYCIVKWFDNKKGYGFLQCGKKDVFVHHSTITAQGFKTLNEGERVLAEVIDSPKGPKAVSVTRNPE